MIEFHYHPVEQYWRWQVRHGENSVTGAAYEITDAIEAARAAEDLLRLGMQVEPPSAG